MRVQLLRLIAVPLTSYYSVSAGNSGWAAGVGTLADYPVAAGTFFTTPSVTWSPTLPGNFWTPNLQYHVSALAEDGAGNVSVVQTTNTFVYDVYAPTVTITVPAAAWIDSATMVVQGTMTVTNPDVVASVQVRLERQRAHLALQRLQLDDDVRDLAERGLVAQRNRFLVSQFALGHESGLHGRGTDSRPGRQRRPAVLDRDVDRGLHGAVLHHDVARPRPDLHRRRHVRAGRRRGRGARLGGISGVNFSYYDNAVGKWWSATSGQFNSGVEVFYPGTFAGGVWTATGNSTPTWVLSGTGVTYQVFAQVVDLAGNVTVRPGGPAANSALIQFTLVTPTPVSAVTLPAVNNSAYRLAGQNPPPTSFAGTVIAGTTEQVRITNGGAVNDLVGNSGSAVDQWWNGSAWVSTNTPVGPLGDGFIGVATLAGGVWTYNVNMPTWLNQYYYTVEARGFDVYPAPPGVAEPGPPYVSMSFTVDGTPPSVGLVSPVPTAAYERFGQLTSLTGTATDLAVGNLQNQTAQFTIAQASAPTHFWTGYVFSSTTPVLPATFIGGNSFTYNDTNLTNGTIFADGYAYTVQLGIQNQAELPTSPAIQGLSAARTFLYDVSFPTATVGMPSNGIAINSLPLSTGTYSDPNPHPADPGSAASGVVEVDVFIQSQHNGAYFDGTGFLSAVPFPLIATLNAGSWSYTDANLDGSLTDGRYTMYARARQRRQRPVQLRQQRLLGHVLHRQDRPRDRTAHSRRRSGLHFGEYSWDRHHRHGLGSPGQRHVERPAAQRRGRPALVRDGPAPAITGTGINWSTTLTTITATGNSWNLLSQPPASGGPNSWAGVQPQTFFVTARAHDQSTLGNGGVSPSTGNVSAFLPAVSFIVQDTLPLSSMTNVTDGSFINALGVLSGTANSFLAGTNKVEVCITTVTTANCGGTGPDWTGSSYTFTVPYWSTAVIAGSNWTYSNLSGAFSDDLRYYLYSRAIDNAGNVQSPLTVYAVTYDVTPPSLSIGFPNSPPIDPPYSNNAESVRQITVISGATGDAGGLASGVQQVWLAISSGSAQNVWWSDATKSFSVNQAAIDWSTMVYVSGAGWSYSPAAFATTAFADGGEYSVFAYAVDKAGNYENYATLPSSAAALTQPFKYNVTRPTSTVSFPANGSDVSSVPSFSGTSVSTGPNSAGIYRVFAAIRHTAGGAAVDGWWNWGTGAFDATIADPPPAPPSAAWTQVASTTIQGLTSLAWSTPTPVGMLESSATYRLVSDAEDNATNIQQNPSPVGSGSAFRYDTQIPTAAITAPTLLGFLNASTLGSLLGTAADPGAAGLSNVQILLKVRDLQAYWTGATSGLFGTDWDSTPPGRYNHWQTVTGLYSWSQAFPPMADVDSRQFEVWVRATDGALLQSPTPSTGQLDANQNWDGTNAYSFNYDNTPPVSGVVYPPDFTGFVPTTITGTAVDSFPLNNPSGVVDLRIELKRSTGEYWSLINSTWTGPGDSVSAFPGFLNTGLTGLNPWKFTGFAGAFLDGYQYSVNPQSVDAANNLENVYSTYTFMVDLSTPVSGVTLPLNNGWSNLNIVTLSGTAEDRFCTLNPLLNPGCANPARKYESGIASVTVAIADITTSTNWWTGSNFTSGSPTYFNSVFSGASSGTWSYALPPGR